MEGSETPPLFLKQAGFRRAMIRSLEVSFSRIVGLECAVLLKQKQGAG